MAAPMGNKNHLAHGGCGTRLYNIWKTMRQRCNNPKSKKYESYGKRGIEICPEWTYFADFREWAINNGYCDELTIDRIDVNKDYSPDNCRWTNYIVQANNKRNNAIIDFMGFRGTMADFCRVNNLNYKLFAKYYKRGMAVPEAIAKAA